MKTFIIISFVSLIQLKTHITHLNHSMIPGINVEEKTISASKFIIGKNFTGSFDKTSSYLNDVKADLASRKIAYNELEAVSIYLSDPSAEKPDQLKSYHGFVIRTEAKTNELVDRKLESGKYLVTSTKNDSLVWAMFEEAYTFAGRNGIKLSEHPPVMISTVENEKPLFSIYFQIH